MANESFSQIPRHVQHDEVSSAQLVVYYFHSRIVVYRDQVQAPLSGGSNSETRGSEHLQDLNYVGPGPAIDYPIYTGPPTQNSVAGTTDYFGPQRLPMIVGCKLIPHFADDDSF